MIVRFLRQHGLLLLIVVLPTLAALVYFALVASDVYLSESRFVVRGAQAPPMSEGVLGTLLAGGGLSRSLEDTYLVHDYIRSRDALAELDRTLDLGKNFRSKNIDVASRFPGTELVDSFESLLRYYRRHVTVELDPATSISVLTVRAYDPQQAQRINQTLLDMAERLVNSINERSRRDLVQAAEHDVGEAERKARDASVALRDFRSAHAVFQPEKQAELELSGIAHLQDELIEAQAQLVELTRLTPQNPRIEVMRTRIQTLQENIAANSARLTAGGGSLASDAQRMNRLVVDLEFSDRLLVTSLASLEAARSQALRQELYLDRVVLPNLPDYALEPRRVHSVLTVLVVGLLAWGVVRLVVAAIGEHGE